MCQAVEHCRRIISNAVFENDSRLTDIAYRRNGITLYHDNVGILTRRENADVLILSQKPRAIVGRHANCFLWCEAGFHQQFQLMLIAVARQDPTPASWIDSGDQ